MLDELPSLELSATAVALALVVRVAVLLRREGADFVRGRSRVESARARDLVGLAILAGALVYAVRVERASTWFSTAVGIAIGAQLLGFFLRAAARKRSGAAQAGSAQPDGSDEGDGDDEAEQDPGVCPVCGHASLIELVDTGRLLGGLSQLTAVSALVCPACGALSGEVEDAAKIPVGPEHGTALRTATSGKDQEALEEPAEHDG
ncbi:MAG TPA: hypothetical protein VJN18_21845 [Polyangiaceae bacterium]|nr:hypothetical protein [Polyangiaceae bacterium]